MNEGQYVRRVGGWQELIRSAGDGRLVSSQPAGRSTTALKTLRPEIGGDESA
jgi:hypothetical protein